MACLERRNVWMTAGMLFLSAVFLFTGGQNIHAADSNIALGKTVTAETNSVLGEPSHIVDGDTATYWYSYDGSVPIQQRFVLDLGAVYTISRIDMEVLQVYGVTLSSSVDGSTYTDRYTWTGGSYCGPLSESSGGYDARYIKYFAWADHSQYVGLSEIEVYGAPASGTTDPGTTDPGTTDPGTTDPGTTDPTSGDLEGFPITEEQLAAMMPSCGIQEGVYPDHYAFNVSGFDNIVTDQAQVTMSGLTIRIENLLVKNVQMWFDLGYKKGTFVFTNSGTGAPDPLPDTNTSLLNASLTEVWLTGPPLGIHVAAFVLGDTVWDVDLSLKGNPAGFAITSLEKIGTYDDARQGFSAFADVRKRRVPKTIDEYIEEQTLVEPAIPGFATFEDTLQHCLSAVLDAANLSSYAGTVLQKFAKNAVTMIPAIQDSLRAGEVSDATIILSNFAARSLLEASETSEELTKTLKKMAESSGYYDAGTSALGTTCGGDWKEGLTMVLWNIIKAALPGTTCAIQAVIDASIMAHNWVDNECARTVFNNWRATSPKLSCAADPACLSGSCSEKIIHTARGGGLLARITGRYKLTQAEAEEQLADMFDGWLERVDQAPAREAYLEDLKDEYEGLMSYEQSALNHIVNSGEDASRITDLERFLKYKEIVEKFRRDIVGKLDVDEYVSDAQALTMANDMAGEMLYKISQRKSKSAFAATTALMDNAYNETLAKTLQEKAPDIYKNEPAVCKLPQDDGLCHANRQVKISLSLKGSHGECGDYEIMRQNASVYGNFVWPYDGPGVVQGWMGGDYSPLTFSGSSFSGAYNGQEINPSISGDLECTGTFAFAETDGALLTAHCIHTEADGTEFEVKFSVPLTLDCSHCDPAAEMTGNKWVRYLYTSPGEEALSHVQEASLTDKNGCSEYTFSTEYIDVFVEDAYSSHPEECP